VPRALRAHHFAISPRQTGMTGTGKRSPQDSPALTTEFETLTDLSPPIPFFSSS